MPAYRWYRAVATRPFGGGSHRVLPRWQTYLGVLIVSLLTTATVRGVWCLAFEDPAFLPVNDVASRQHADPRAELRPLGDRRR